jgi:predicted amidohydrolase
MANKILAAAVQMNCVLNKKEQNLDLAHSLVRDAGAPKLDLVVFPELFSTGYRVEENDGKLAESIPGPTTEWMQKLAREYKAFVIGAILEQSPACKGVIYDTAVLVGPDGLMGRYRKICLWQNEALRFHRGADLPVFDLGFAKIGIQICYEAGFPENARILTLKGADILVYSAAFNALRTHVWDIATRARAVENGIFLVAGNRYGTEKNETTFSALSRIVDPQGEVLAEAVQENQVIVQELDLSLIQKQRIALPYLRDYNIALYKEQFDWLCSSEKDEIYRKD